MKYVALIYNNPGAFEALSPAERDQLMSEADAYLKEYTDTGELLTGGYALADAVTAKTVRVRDGLLNVTDGPFAEAKETISYALYQVRSKEEAVEWASRFMKLHRDLWPGWDGESDVLRVFGPEDFAPPSW
jgi:hypothetical protein